MAKNQGRRRSLDEWFDIINTCRSSGMTDKDWCESNGVSIDSFYAAVRRLRTRACEIPASAETTKSVIQEVVPLQIIDTPVSLQSPDSAALLPSDHADISLCINNIKINISNSANPALVCSIIKMLSSSC